MTRAAAQPVMALVTGIAEYQVRVIKGLTDALDPLGIPLLVVANEPFGSDRTPPLVLDLIRRRVPRGVVALGDTAPFPQPDLPVALLDSGLAVVTLGSRFADAPMVLGDNHGGMQELMRHLLDEVGVRRVALVRGIPGHSDSEAREKVLREELARRGLHLDDDLVVDGRFRPTESYDALHRLLVRRRDFEAVVTLNDMSAFGALSALTDHGLRVPQDVLLSGFDNTQGSLFTWPPLTTVDHNLEQQGAEAVGLLLRLVDGLPCPRDVLVPARVVVRTSTSPARGGPGGPDGAGRDGAGTADEASRVATMRALQNQVALQDAAAYLGSSLANCRTMPEIIRAVEPRLSRLGVDRCFVAIDSGIDSGEASSRLVFSYRAGAAEPPSEEDFPRHELLPPSLRGELTDGVLLLQALAVDGRERGFLLFEPVPHSYLLTESLRVDLPRSVDVVLSWQEMRDHSTTLQRLVAERTGDLERANAELRRSVMRDGLTGIANRLALEQYLDELLPAGDPQTRRVSLLMIDVDMFKAFNDHYGHLAGDAALRTLAACLDGAAHRPQDLACRYGGEEFVVVLPDTPIEGALALARRFRRLLARAAVPHAASRVAPVLTASIGAASLEVGAAGATRNDLVAIADRALYRAKTGGRDRIVTGSTRGIPQPAFAADADEPAGGWSPPLGS